MPRPKHPLRYRYPLHIHIPEKAPVCKLQIRPVIGPGIFHLVMPVPPVISVCASVQNSLSGYCYVTGAAGVDKAEIVAGRRLPVGVYQGIVALYILIDKRKDRIFGCQMQLHPAL